MPINIREDRRLSVTWCKYKNILADMNKRLNRQNFIKNEMNVNKLSQWEATLAFEEEIKKVERQRREEMNQIRKQIITEKEKFKALNKNIEEEEERNRLAALEEKRNARALRKEEMKVSPPPLRRSARVHSKNSDDYDATWKRGSFYKKA